MTDALQLGFAGMGPQEDPGTHARNVMLGRCGPWPPTALQSELIRLLLLHQGAHRAIPLRDLMGKLDRVCKPIPSEREIKDAARSLVVDFKVRIGASRSKPVGYFLITSAEEARDTARPYISEIRELARRVRVLLDPHDLGRAGRPAMDHRAAERYRPLARFSEGGGVMTIYEALAQSRNGVPPGPRPSVCQLFKHKADCLWISPLPTGEGYFGCTCGLDKLLFELEDFELSVFPVAAPSECGQYCGRSPDGPVSLCKKPRGHDGSCNPLHGLTFAAPSSLGMEQVAREAAKEIARLATATHEGCPTIGILRCNIERLGAEVILESLRHSGAQPKKKENL